MKQSINLFLDNSNLTNLNSLTHLLDFDDNYNDLTKSIQPSKYYSEDVLLEKTDTNSCIIMSLNCQLKLTCKIFANKITCGYICRKWNTYSSVMSTRDRFENSDNIDLGLYHIDNYYFVTKKPLCQRPWWPSILYS